MADSGLTCRRCGRAIGEAPRVRTKTGEAICLGCLTTDERRRLAGAAARARGEERRSEAGGAASVAAESSSSGADDPDDAMVELLAPAPRSPREHLVAPSASGGGRAPAIEAAAPGPTKGDPCPCCGRPRLADVKKCLGCGYDPTIGVTSSNRFRGERQGDGRATCPACRYQLHGVRSLKCPECGEALVGEKGFRAWRREQAVQGDPAHYRKPALLLAIGLAITMIVGSFEAFAGGAGAVEAGRAVGGLLGGFAIVTVIALVVFTVYAVVFGGVDEPIPLLVLSIGATMAMTFATGAIVELVPLPLFFPVIVVAAVQVHFLVTLLDQEVQDAAVVTVLTWLGAAGTILLLGVGDLIAGG